MRELVGTVKFPRESRISPNVSRRQAVLQSSFGAVPSDARADETAVF